MWTEVLFLPGFNILLPNPLVLEFNDVNLWIFILVILVITTLGGAGYPSLYISRFQPTSILRDKVRFGSKNTFRRLLLGFQYFFSFITIICAIIFIQNDKFQKSIEWGYGKDEVITVNVKGTSNFEKLKNEIIQIPEVISVAGSENQIGRSQIEISIEIDKIVQKINQLSIGWDYIETMGLELSQGRDFDNKLKTDGIRSVIVNKKFTDKMGWNDPLGKLIKIKSQNYYVIGELKDFHYQSFETEIDPLVIRITDPVRFQYLSVKINFGSLLSVATEMEGKWKELFPDDPYTFFYQDSVFDRDFQQYNLVTGVLTTAGIIAIFLATIGLYGLSSMSIKSRLKEISIRKVLGGDWVNLGYILNKEFIYLLTLSSILAAPFGYYAVLALLDTITKFSMPITITPFLLTGVLLLILSVLAVGGHVFKVIRSNPTDALRMD